MLGEVVPDLGVGPDAATEAWPRSTATTEGLALVTPPAEMIERARLAALRSPCAKSRRGVVVYDPGAVRLLGRGWNGQPEPFGCSGDDACRAACGKLCVHAESRALATARLSTHADKHDLHNTHLLHVKVVDELVVAGGPPSCWQCSREILDADLGGVWLFEERTGARSWRFYTAVEFHEATLLHAGLPVRIVEPKDEW